MDPKKTLYIEITDEKVEEFKGTSAKTGRDYHVRRQNGWLHQGDSYPLPFTLSLPEGQSAYKAGRYVFGAKTFQAGQYGLEFARNWTLVPMGV